MSILPGMPSLPQNMALDLSDKTNQTVAIGDVKSGRINFGSGVPTTALIVVGSVVVVLAFLFGGKGRRK
ncbi:MAG: hypothetical protein MI744_10070 [Pseudomonadales bacterium]|nr:hypothetical protein [Pseudomonadales bacterium]